MHPIDNLAKITNSWNQQPIWNRFNNRLYWIDKHSQYLFSLDTHKNTVEQIKLPEPIISLSLYDDCTDKFLVTLKQGVGVFNLSDQTIEYLAKPEPLLTQNHFCGGVVGPNNDYWTQSASGDALKSSGYIYTLDAHNGVKRFNGATLFDSSCPVVSQDGQYLYQVSHHDRYIYKSELNSDNIHQNSVFCRISKTEGKPCGICLDSEDHLWVCHLGGGLVSRFNPEGERVEKIKIQANNVTHCTFGGEELDTLFITTASFGLTDQGKRKQPMSGSILRIRFDKIRGIAENVFLPAPKT